MIKGIELPLKELYEMFCAEQYVIDEAEEISVHGTANGRTKAERLGNAIKGIALQYALGQYLVTEGYTVETVDFAKDKIFHYDLVVNGVKVDVKGRWTGKYFNQSAFEEDVIKKTGDRVLYACIDIMPDGRFIARGECWSDDLSPSQYMGQWVQKFSDIL